MKKTQWGFLLPLSLAAFTTGSLELTAGQPVPCNVFETGSTVRLPVTVSNKAPLAGTLRFEVRDSGYRFGMKLWLIREIRWNRKLHCDPGKVMQVCCNLGLQWTRAQLGQKEHMDTAELIRNYPVNMVLKVETYPDEMIDRDRYPDIADFTKVTM